MVILGTDSPSEILDIIKKIQKSGVGDEKRINFLEKIVKMGKNLKPEDEEYLITLYHKLGDTSNKEKTIPKIDVEEFKKSLNDYKSHLSELTKEKISESKFKIAGSKSCARCSTKLGFRKMKPDPLWGISDYLCKTCFDFIRLKVTNYDATVKEASMLSMYQLESLNKRGTVLSIQNFDNQKRIVFGNNLHPKIIEIQIQNFESHEIIEYEEESTTKKILTMGIRKTKTNPHISIVFQKNNQRNRIVFDSKDLAKVDSSIGNLVLQYQRSKSKEYQNL